MITEAENCPLCGREMVPGPSVDAHHLVPKCKGGRATTLMHKICHRKIHSVFSEGELAGHYNSADKLLEHPEIAKFVKWVKNKEPEFYTSHRDHQRKRR